MGRTVDDAERARGRHADIAEGKRKIEERLIAEGFTTDTFDVRGRSISIFSRRQRPRRASLGKIEEHVCLTVYNGRDGARELTDLLDHCCRFRGRHPLPLRWFEKIPVSLGLVVVGQDLDESVRSWARRPQSLHVVMPTWTAAVDVHTGDVTANRSGIRPRKLGGFPRRLVDRCVVPALNEVITGSR